MQKKKKFLSAVSLAFGLFFGCAAFASCGRPLEQEPEPEPEPESQTNIVWEYKTWTYERADGTQATLDYALYFPDSYSDTGAPMPLIAYIPDSGYTTRSIGEVTVAECPANWVTAEKTEKNPAVFLVLTFTQVGEQNGGAVTGLSDASVPYSEASQVNEIIDDIAKVYNIDTDRLYLTGQSMGGIFDWSLNTLYPDKFAATVYVGCQPGDEVDDDMYRDILEKKAFVNQKFIYIASRLDSKAPFGQDAVEEALKVEGKTEGVDYIKYYELDKSDAAGNSATLQTLFHDGISQYFLGFPFVISATSAGGMEHLRSFTPSYAIDAIYDWLLSQSNAD